MRGPAAGPGPGTPAGGGATALFGSLLCGLILGPLGLNRDLSQGSRVRREKAERQNRFN